MAASVMMKLSRTLFFLPIRFMSSPEGMARKAKLINAIMGRKDVMDSLSRKSSLT